MDMKIADPKGLVRESYVIKGITEGECRSIFLDWALSLPADAAAHPAMEALLAHYAGENPDHPMTLTLRQGLSAPEAGKRRGGRAARVKGG